MDGYFPVETGRRRTLKSAIGCVGTGLHSGRRVSLTLRPAPAGTGIVFRRTDIGFDDRRPLRQRGGHAALHRARHPRRPWPQHRHRRARDGGAGRLRRGRRAGRGRRPGSAHPGRLRRALRLPHRLRRHRFPGRQRRGRGDRGAAPGAGAGRRRPRRSLGRAGADAPERLRGLPHHRFPGHRHRPAVPRAPPVAAELPRRARRCAHLHPGRGGGGAPGRRAGARRQPGQRRGGGRAAGAEPGRAAPARTSSSGTSCSTWWATWPWPARRCAPASPATAPAMG